MMKNYMKRVYRHFLPWNLFFFAETFQSVSHNFVKTHRNSFH